MVNETTRDKGMRVESRDQLCTAELEVSERGLSLEVGSALLSHPELYSLDLILRRHLGLQEIITETTRAYDPHQSESCLPPSPLTHEQLSSPPSSAVIEHVSHNATISPPSGPELLVPSTFPANHQTLDTSMLCNHTASAIALGELGACHLESYTGGYREEMGADESSGAGRFMDGIEGSDEDRLA